MPSETLPPGLTESEWSATVRVGATGVVGGVVCDPLPPEDVPPPATVVPPDDVGPVGVEPLVLPVVVPDEELPLDEDPVEPVDVVVCRPGGGSAVNCCALSDEK